MTYTVEFKSIRQSRITEGTWCAEIWSLSRVTKGYWRKVRTVTTNQIWQFWPKIRFSASKWLILALAAYLRYEFDTKQCQSIQLNSYNWRNFDHVTASKAGWRKENFVRHVTVTKGCRFELNSTVDSDKNLKSDPLTVAELYQVLKNFQPKFRAQCQSVLSWLSTLLSCHTREWQSSILLPCSPCDMGSKRRWQRWRLPHGFRAPDESDTTHLGESIGNYNISRSIERITRKIMWLITYRGSRDVFV